MTLVIPARNEAQFLPLVLRTAHQALSPETLLVLSDSASTDETPKVVELLMRDLPQLRYVRVPEPGKGLAIRTAWEKFPADALAFMDADLATNVEALVRLREAMGSADLVIGSRRHPESRVTRTLGRRLVSRCFHLMFRWHFPKVVCSDTTCGLKAIRGDWFVKLAPRLQNLTWFFDTELVVVAAQAGARLQELPLIWNERILPERKTSVRIFKVAREYLAGLRRLKESVVR